MAVPVYKQYTVKMDARDYRLVRQEASDKKTSIAALLRTWLEPHLQDLRNKKKELEEIS